MLPIRFRPVSASRHATSSVSPLGVTATAVVPGRSRCVCRLVPPSGSGPNRPSVTPRSSTAATTVPSALPATTGPVRSDPVTVPNGVRSPRRTVGSPSSGFHRTRSPVSVRPTMPVLVGATSASSVSSGTSTVRSRYGSAGSFAVTALNSAVRVCPSRSRSTASTASSWAFAGSSWCTTCDVALSRWAALAFTASFARFASRTATTPAMMDTASASPRAALIRRLRRPAELWRAMWALRISSVLTSGPRSGATSSASAVARSGWCRQNRRRRSRVRSVHLGSWSIRSASGAGSAVVLMVSILFVVWFQTILPLVSATRRVSGSRLSSHQATSSATKCELAAPSEASRMR